MAAISVESALQLARTYQSMGQLAAAESTLRQIVAAHPDHADALLQLAMHYRSLARNEEAVACFDAARKLAPQSAEISFQWAHGLLAANRLTEAIAAFEHVAALQPGDTRSHNDLGHGLALLCRWDEAIVCFQRAVDIDPTLTQAHYNMGTAYFALNRMDEARRCFEQAVALRPDYTEALANLGSAQLELGLFAEGLAAYELAAASQPANAATRWNLAVALLLHGRHADGWQAFEARLLLSTHAGKYAQPRWDGRPMPGETLLLTEEQGYGDTIHFLRYLPIVRERTGAAHPVLDCRTPLHALVRRSIPDLEIVDLEIPGAAEQLRFDRHVALPSLPYVLGMFEPLGMTAPYLRADPARRTLWHDRLAESPRRKIGLAWAGNPLHFRDRYRSIDPARFLPLLQIPGLEFHSLQWDCAGALPPPLTARGLIDPSPSLADFDDTAALIEELDLVITVDTATAHLAGALGRPVWTLLPLYPDWRWGLERGDTVWYPSMRLWRQKAFGDWDEVIARVAREFRAWPASGK